MSDVARAARLLREATRDLGAAELSRPVPSCPGWTVSDALTHVAENLAGDLAEAGLRPETADVLTAYELHAAELPRAEFQVLDMTLHAWDIGRALGRPVELGDADLDLRMTERARRGRVSVATRGADAFGAGEAREQSGTRRPAPSRF